MLRLIHLSAPLWRSRVSPVARRTRQHAGHANWQGEGSCSISLCASVMIDAFSLKYNSAGEQSKSDVPIICTTFVHAFKQLYVGMASRSQYPLKMWHQVFWWAPFQWEKVSYITVIYENRWLSFLVEPRVNNETGPRCSEWWLTQKDTPLLLRQSISHVLVLLWSESNRN